MNNKKNIILIVILVLVLVLFLLNNKKIITHAKIIERGTINTFENGLTDSEGELFIMESSAIVFDGKDLIIANDKSMDLEDYSSIFSVDYDNGVISSDSVNFLNQSEFNHANKFEDLTITADSEYIFATTGFDRVKDDSAEWNPYNTLLYWENGDLDSVQLISSSTIDDYTSSVDIKTKLTDLFGVSYFKIEGLAAIPNNVLLFGVREMGKSYKDFDYVIHIVSVSYEITDSGIVLNDDFKVVYDFDPSSFDLGHEVGLSSIEYNKYTDSLMILTSFEDQNELGEITDEDLGGFLWQIPIDLLYENSSPYLIKKDDSTPLMFAHKAEGLTVIAKNLLVVIHDDDDVFGDEDITNIEKEFYREANQAAFSIVELSY